MARGFVLLLICLFTSGCFVFDEIDKGNKILDKNFSKKAEAKPAPPAAAANAPKTGSGWWASAKSLTGPVSDEGGNDPAVSCQVGGSTRFMRKSDCLSQGGKPAR
jgi:hypothetical protein